MTSEILRRGVTVAGVLGMAALAVAALAAEVDRDPAAPEPIPSEKAAPFAVVELFTSEGCNSCPAADRLAATIASEAEQGAGGKGKDVYVLAFHVDYWDRLGWPDRFASAAFSERQRRYAGALKGGAGGDRGVYTPQMVVNGAVGFVGSDAGRARAEIATGLKRGAPVTIDAAAARMGEDGRVGVQITVKGDVQMDACTACAAIVENGLSTVVERGENGGRTLKHERVVRAFATAPLGAAKERSTKGSGQAAVELTAPAGVDRAKSRVVVFVQEKESMRIVGATEIEIQQIKSKPMSATSDR